MEGRSDMSRLVVKDEYLAKVLRGEEYLLQDGAMGTLLLSRGLFAPGSIPELLNLDEPDAIKAIHAEYVEAGAMMVTTNTFGANARKLSGHASVSEVFNAAVSLAREAGARYIGADIGPLGLLLEPYGDTCFEEAQELFAEQVKAACDAGADIIVIETMIELEEMKAAVSAARDNCALPIFASMSFEPNGRTFMGVGAEEAVSALAPLGVQMVGANCSQGPEGLLPVIECLAANASCLVGARPNAGLPRIVNEQSVYDMSPDDFSLAMEPIIEAGATVVGGCCGTTPAFIKTLASLLDR